MIIVSKDAQNHFLNLLKKQKLGTNIRVYVKHPGTPIAKCGVSYCYKDEITEFDIPFKMNGFYIYIYKSHISYLTNSKIDIRIEDQNSCLTLVAPFANKCVFIDDNELLDKVKYFLDSKINPQLSVHGGYVELVNITKSGYVSLKFSGGCNGCSMIGRTLKDGIESQIKSFFSEINGVYDVTQHNYGNHSYY
ncbi:MAG: NfuA family Fe-S biogenesis protein [Buchnera aphidicola (Chaetogeoica yunlongensis)]